MWRIFLRSEVWIFPTRAYGAGSSSWVRRLPETCAPCYPFPAAIGISMRWSSRFVEKRYWLWRAIDNGGKILDFLVPSKPNAQAALKLMLQTAEATRLGTHPDYNR